MLKQAGPCGSRGLGRRAVGQVNDFENFQNYLLVSYRALLTSDSDPAWSTVRHSSDARLETLANVITLAARCCSRSGRVTCPSKLAITSRRWNIREVKSVAETREAVVKRCRIYIYSCRACALRKSLAFLLTERWPEKVSKSAIFLSSPLLSPGPTKQTCDPAVHRPLVIALGLKSRVTSLH